jgi:tetratricopeptide (TPR) repeat protein
MLAALGRFDEALKEIRRAEELHPLSHAISVTVAVVLFVARKYDEAIDQLKKTLALEPNFASAHAWLGILYAATGRHEIVEPAVNRAVELSPDNPNVLVGLAYSHAMRGNKKEALEALDRGEPAGGAAGSGMVYAQLGDMDSAFERMERAFEVRESWDSMFWLKVFPWYDPLRSDPRYHGFLRRMNFPE